MIANQLLHPPADYRSPSWHASMLTLRSGIVRSVLRAKYRALRSVDQPRMAFGQADSLTVEERKSQT